MTSSAQRVTVLVYPWDVNPYQKSLYGAMPEGSTSVATIRAVPQVGPFPFLVGATFWRARGFDILHLHWPNFGLRLRGAWAPRLSLWASLISIVWARALGYTIVWTLHNVVPHEKVTSDDLRVAGAVAKRSSSVIVHSEGLVGAAEDLGAKSVVVVPQGNYAGTYPETTLSKQSAGTVIGTLGADWVLLFFGLIRAYKGVTRLIRTFVEVAGDGDRLVVAGQCEEEALLRQIREHADRRLILRTRHVPDNEVAVYFRAADVACFPFDQVTTTSSAVLALAYGVPIIAPRLGTLKDLPEAVGWFYDAADPRGLATAIKLARSAGEQERSDRRGAAFEFASSTTWDQVAHRTRQLYITLAEQRRMAPGK